MSGQSVVHTGSRKVSSTTLPRRLARETCRPSWLVSVKLGAGVSSRPLLPAMDCATIGSAFLLTEATAIGAAPTRMMPSAPTPAMTRTRRPGERAQQLGHPPGSPRRPGRLGSTALAGLGRLGGVLGRPVPVALSSRGVSGSRPAALGGGSVAGQRLAAARRRRCHRQVPGGEQQDERDHRVRVGAEPAEEPEVLDEQPVGEAEHRPGDDHDPGEPRVRADRGGAQAARR